MLRYLITASLFSTALFHACKCENVAAEGEPEHPDEGEGEGEEGEGEGDGEGEGEPACVPQEGVPGLTVRPVNTACAVPARPPYGGTIDLVEPWPNLQTTSPLFLVQEPGTNNMVVIERAGRVIRFDKDDAAVTTPEVLGDLTDRVDTSDAPGDERGLLGMAFHPDWPQTEELFFAYTGQGTSGAENRVSRFTLAGDGTLDEGSEDVLLAIEDFASNHNGGMLAFGPDGMLYVGTGDGGGGGDPNGNGQNPQALLGKILRIDVDTVTAPFNYGIPADNPFAADAAFDPAIFAWGLRNPWRFSFDRATGELWVGDVGQDELEEIDVVEGGGNYGWDTFEGTNCFNDGSACPSTAGFIPPLYEYSHVLGRTAIIGGYVYNGSAIPEMNGSYLFADGSSQELFQLLFDVEGNPLALDWPGVELDGAGGYVSSFSEDADGELYVLLVEANGIQKLVPAGAPEPTDFPQQLSETGCVDATDPRLPSSSVLPYDLNHPSWADGATMTRTLALPDGTTIDVTPEGDMELQNGSVLVQHLQVDGDFVETRVLMRHDDGYWSGYSYEWNDAQTDATLLPPAGKRKELPNGQVWEFPSRRACLQCHTNAAGRTLGLELAQLNRAFDYGDQHCGNQLTTLDAIGLLTSPLPDSASNLPVLPAFDDASAGVDERARAVLHVNCSGCHRPGGGAGDADMRLNTDFGVAGLCDVDPVAGDLGVSNAKLVAPGDPARSLVSVRMHRQGLGRMPRVGTLEVDEASVDVVDQFISGLPSCP